MILILFFGPLNRELEKPDDPITYVGARKEDAIGDYLDGIGTRASPYVIRNVEDLKTLRKFVNAGNSYSSKYFIQTQDIDLQDDIWRVSIGNAEDTPFNGYYEGNGHTIKNLHLLGKEHAGLFGYLGGVVCDLSVDGVVEGETYAGGIVGKTISGRALLLNCYSQTDVSAEYAGGLVGENNGVLVYCFNTGTLDGTVTRELAAENRGGQFLCTTSTAMMKKNGYRCTITDDDFATEKAAFTQRAGEIELGNFWQQAVRYILNGRGTQKDPYRINNVEELCAFRDIVNSGYLFGGEWVRQTTDLDLKEITNWEPIGLFGSGNYFDGVYDGGGHMIRSLQIYSDENVGFFGQLGGTVMNLGIESGTIRGACVGAIASHGDGTSNTAILNCYNRSTVIGIVRAGGIVDNFTNGSIINCVNYGEIKADEEVKDQSTVTLAEIASYAGNITHCVLEQSKQERKAGISYTDMTVTKNGQEAAAFLNTYLYKLGSQSGFQNSNFVKWGTRGLKPSLTTEYEPYTVHFFRQEVLVLLILLAAALGLTCYYRSKTPLGLLRDGRTALKQVSWNQKAITAVFTVTMTLTVVGMLLGDGNVFRNTFWLDSNDTFMDWYNPMYTMQSGNIPLYDFYSKNTGGYPPIARFILWVVGNVLPRDVVAAGAFGSRARSIMLFVVLTIAVVIALFAIISKMKLRNKWLIYLAIVFSTPMLYTIERGNIILFSIVLSLLFVAGIEGEKRERQDASYFALALAAGIKIYPAIYGLLLVAKRKWKETFNLICWGLSVFLLPFLFTGGFQSFLKCMQNLGGFVSSNKTRGRYWLINYGNVLTEISENFGVPALPSRVVTISLLVLVVLLIACVFVQKSYWKQNLALTLVLVLLPGANVYYVAAFYSIPLLLAFREESEDRSVLSRLLVLCLCLALAPLQFLCGTYGLTQANIQFFCGLLGLVMAALLLLDSGILLGRTVWEKLRARKAAGEPEPDPQPEVQAELPTEAQPEPAEKSEEKVSEAETE